ncbi:putative GNAT family acetyltransferase [Bacillus ectoiniformans]|uniref:GNAT family N-acetyltransferase n=1 Tax=Bacillus ectoiniformans TaxID=1494429 RepID=UPI001EF78C8F|nr:GNAT family N-acetyltransferase [Bacillus ectoiniformans]MBM7649835.1 putative GNAT family acetyltransferase [Bacillus ectoiniformans]
MTQIQQEEGRFFIDQEGVTLAELTYTKVHENVIDVNHTYVSDQLRGQGIAAKLLQSAVDYARKEGKKILPTCTYAKSKLENNEQYQDILAD